MDLHPARFVLVFGVNTNATLETKFARSATDTPPPVPILPRAGYLEQPGPIRVIFGSFAFLTLPIAAVVLWLPEQEALPWLYLWLFGGTHLALTLTIYGSRANRRYFTSTPRNVAIFVAVPIAILAAYLGLRFVDIPWLAVAFAAGLRFFNFFHLTRQTFGVHQLLKVRERSKFPNWAKRTENATGFALIAALMATHAAGGICPWLTDARLELRWLWSASLLATVGFHFASLSAVRGHAVPALYTTLQLLGTVAATFYLPLYLAALAMHYVEYHTLMIPRIAKQELETSSPIDRGYGWLRSRPILFGAAVLAISAAVTAGMSSMDRPAAEGFRWTGLLAAFDALVAVHYFLEMFIWKFSDPHIRKSLDGVYFAKRG